MENFKTISDFDLIVFSTMLCLGSSDETLTSSAFQAIDLILVFRHLKVYNLIIYPLDVTVLTVVQLVWSTCSQRSTQLLYIRAQAKFMNNSVLRLR